MNPRLINRRRLNGAVIAGAVTLLVPRREDHRRMTGAR